jgi:hypothetical protein
MSDWSIEPPLDELLADPTTRLLMSGDHVRETALRALLACVGRVLKRREQGPNAEMATEPCLYKAAAGEPAPGACA